MVTLTPFTEPVDGIRHSQPETSAYFNETNLGKGTLYIAESRLSWIGSTGNGFAVEYPHISLHAISRDLSAYPQECLFLMLDDPDNESEQGNDDQKINELRFVPEDKGMLDAMFHAMSACQTLHPDPNNSYSEEEEEEEAGEENDDDDVDDGIVMEETDSQLASLTLEQNRQNGQAGDADMDDECYEDADHLID